ncbi:MAG TPA: thermonuclease family protein [Chloroflexota bacterium]|jgi:micrococcal nuclease|nr:thermonuclease family protein [Chloroflexota bacterium]
MLRRVAGLALVPLLLACGPASPTVTPVTALEQRLAQRAAGELRSPVPRPTAAPHPPGTRTPEPTADPSAPRRPTPPGPRAPRPAEVVRVDSRGAIVLRVDGREERVALIGVVPVEQVDVGRPVDCFGPEATALLRRAMPVGSWVDVEDDPAVEPRDPGGRLRLYVWLADGTSVNLEMIRQGLGSVPIADRRARLSLVLRLAESEALQAGMGVWSTLSCYDNPDTRPPV